LCSLKIHRLSVFIFDCFGNSTEALFRFVVSLPDRFCVAQSCVGNLDADSLEKPLVDREIIHGQSPARKLSTWLYRAIDRIDRIAKFFEFSIDC
jgi:hypothetical protein